MVKTRGQRAASSKASTSEAPTAAGNAKIVASDGEQLDSDDQAALHDSRGSIGQAGEKSRSGALKASDLSTSTTDEATDEVVERKTVTRIKANPKKNAAPSNRKKGKVDGGLSLLPTMPLDILFAIISKLHPEDLLNLGRSNKLYREMLISPGSKTVWKTAREVYQAPEPPKTFNEAQWSSLLFETTCQSCGDGIGNIDWELQRRVCVACKKEHLVDASQFVDRFPDYVPRILSYVPYTHHNFNGPRKGLLSQGGTQYYWDDDVHTLFPQWDALRRSVTDRGKAEIEAWKAERIEIVNAMTSMTPEYEKYEGLLEELREMEIQENRETRLHFAEARLLDLGYDAEDITRAFSVTPDVVWTGSPNVTPTDWAQLRSKIEPEVIGMRNLRLAEETTSVINPRMMILEELYRNYLDHLRPSERYLCPSPYFLRTLPDVSSIVEAVKSVVVTAEYFASVVETFPEHVSNYHDQRKSALKVRKQGLATDIFLCNSEPPVCSMAMLLGWPMCLSHSCTARVDLELHPGVIVKVPTPISRYPVASTHARKVIKLAGLDPKTATSEKMDKKDLRFVCGSCMTTVGYAVFTWRGLIWHFYEHDMMSVNEPHSIRLATQEETDAARRTDVRRRENAKAWSCNHCCDFLEASETDTKSAVLRHLLRAHRIVAPVLAEDHFLNERCQKQFEAPHIVPQPNVPKYMCLVCGPDIGLVRRLWNEAGILQHWKDYHYDTSPVLGEHYDVRDPFN